jgi:hypothetical protein
LLHGHINSLPVGVCHVITPLLGYIKAMNSDNESPAESQGSRTTVASCTTTASSDAITRRLTAILQMQPEIDSSSVPSTDSDVIQNELCRILAILPTAPHGDENSMSGSCSTPNTDSPVSKPIPHPKGHHADDEPTTHDSHFTSTEGSGILTDEYLPSPVLGPVEPSDDDLQDDFGQTGEGNAHPDACILVIPPKTCCLQTPATGMQQ